MAEKRELLCFFSFHACVLCQATMIIGVWAGGYIAVQLLMPSDARACLSFYVVHLVVNTALDNTAHLHNAQMSCWAGNAT